MKISVIAWQLTILKSFWARQSCLKIQVGFIQVGISPVCTALSRTSDELSKVWFPSTIATLAPICHMLHFPVQFPPIYPVLKIRLTGWVKMYCKGFLSALVIFNFLMDVAKDLLFEVLWRG